MFTKLEKPIRPPERESIHSGHFMVSHFEAEEQDDEDEVAVPVPEVVNTNTTIVPVKQFCTGVQDILKNTYTQQHLEIDTSLSKLFQCMTLAYRQKLTSPKWNRFRGIRLRWKDKIRLNNVIWRCWHLQFVRKENTLICQFASPLDVDTHNKPEAVVLEGKYWKRKLHAVTAEYKKWRMFHRHHTLLHLARDNQATLRELDLLPWTSESSEDVHMLVDEDYMDLMSDTLFSTISNQPFQFPDSREIAKAGLADFIQPSLGPLQPNLDDYMDTFEQEFLMSKLPTVPEEQNDLYKNAANWTYSDLDIMGANSSMQVNTMSCTTNLADYNTTMQSMDLVRMAKEEMLAEQQTQQTNYDNMLLQNSVDQYNAMQRQSPQQQPNLSSGSYQTSVISKSKPSSVAKYDAGSSNQMVPRSIYSKPEQVEDIYQNYQNPTQNIQITTIPMVNQASLPQRQPPSSHHYQIQASPQPEHRVTQSQGYKFSQPSRPNIKFTPQTQKEEKKEQPRPRIAQRGRQRSRSNTREPLKRPPPLISAASDPALLTPANSVLLTQLLSNSNVNDQLVTSNNSVLLTHLLTNTGTATSSDRSNLYDPNQKIHEQQLSPQQVQIKEENSLASCSSRLSQQTSTATLIISTPITVSPIPIQSSSAEPLMQSTYSNSNSPILESSQCLNSPTSSQGSIGSPNRESGCRGGDHRRVGHIHAEQKRRYNIKNGFDMIYSLIPHLNQNPNAKLSKAAMLQKGADYIRQLRVEREQLKEEMDCLRQQIESLNTSISNCQSMLPTNVAPVSIRRNGKIQELFDEYVRTRTMENWKFWIFSLIFRPLLISFNNIVSTSSLDDLYRSTILWVEQHCTLGDLRPVVLNSLRYLSTKTDILTEPDRLSEEARRISLSKNQ